MAGKVDVEGMGELSALLEEMEEKAPGVAAQALYEGAKVMQKAIRQEMNSVKTASFKYAKGGEMRLPSPEEKEVLAQAGIGVARFDKNGAEVNTSVGFNQSGYEDVNWNHMSSQVRTNYKAVHIKGHDSNASSLLKAIGMGKGAQNQKPIGVIANAINSGTSFMKKQPFVRKGEKRGSPQAIEVMKEKIESSFEAMKKK